MNRSLPTYLPEMGGQFDTRGTFDMGMPGVSMNQAFLAVFDDCRTRCCCQRGRIRSTWMASYPIWILSDPPQMDPFGEVRGSDSDIDDGDNLLESVSRAVDDDSVGGFHSD